MEADDVGDFSRREARDAFAVFGVPELHLAVVGGGEEVGAGGVEGGVCDGFGVAGVGAEEFAVVVDVPELDFGVGGRGEEEVAGVGEEAEGGYGFGVGFPGVDELFGHVVLLGAGFFAEVDVKVLRYVHVGAALVVELLGAVELRGFCDSVFLIVCTRLAHCGKICWHWLFLFLLFGPFFVTSQFFIAS